MSVEIGREKLEFTLRERFRQVRRPLNDQEKVDPFYRDKPFRRETLPTGELIFTLKTFLVSGLTREWRDGDRRLEEQISDIVAVLSLAGPILLERRRQAEEEQRLRWKEERKRQEAEERNRLERNRWRRFVELAGTWEEALVASRFIEALERLPKDVEETYGERTAAEWLSWARERRDAFDPTRWPGDVWANLAEVTSWEYRD